MKTKIDVPAIHEKDLRNILEELRLFEKLEKEELFCGNCDKVITWNNLFAFKKIDEEIVLICDEIDCVEKITGK